MPHAYLLWTAVRSNPHGAHVCAFIRTVCCSGVLYVTLEVYDEFVFDERQQYSYLKLLITVKAMLLHVLLRVEMNT